MTTINNNFDVFRTGDGTVSKYIHEDGSETAIKLVKSIQNIVNPLTKEIEVRKTDRNKYSIFISSSVGCYMACKFCHLTLKNAKHIKITEDVVFENLKEAILEKMEFNPELATRYVKLSWMGMGDAINKPDMVYNVTLKILDWIFENKLATYEAISQVFDLEKFISGECPVVIYPKNDEQKKALKELIESFKQE